MNGQPKIDPNLPQRPRKPKVQFTAHGVNVQRGAEVFAQARSANAAERIANALNAYKPDRRGA